MTDDTDDTTDVPVVDPTDPTDPVDPTPAPQDDTSTFVPSLSVSVAGGYRQISQERVQGDVQIIVLDPEQAQQVGWALLSPDAATSDQANEVTTPGFINEGGRFT